MADLTMRRNLIPATCAQCGVAFESRPDQVQRYCSGACYHLSRVKPSPAPRPCVQCGVMFVPDRDRHLPNRNRFCGVQCWQLRRSEIIGRKPRPCHRCGVEYVPERSHQKYCSPECTPRPVSERFWDKVDKSADCWLWTSAKNMDGYGEMLVGRGSNGRYKWERAHRMSYRLAIGPIPKGLWVLHRCDNPPCVRPDHLFLGTAADNAHDRDAKGRDKYSRARNATI